MMIYSNKAIEYNGSFWHAKPDVQARDVIKKEQRESLNIDLLIIEETDWLSNKEQCINRIKRHIMEE